MRTWLGVCCAVALIGCTRTNPAFDGETESVPETGTGTETPPTSEEESGESGSSEGPIDPACEPEEGPGAFIEVVPSCTNDNGVYDRWFNIVDVQESVWEVEQCSPGCEDCEDLVVSPLTLEPLDLAPLLPVPTCIHVTARRLPTPNVDSCEYHTIAVEALLQNQPVPILKLRSAEGLELPPVAGGSEFGAFEPSDEIVDDSCSCDDAPDYCCPEQGLMPTTYAWDIGGRQGLVYIGDTAPVSLDGRAYEFWSLDASHSGECDSPRDMAWAVF